MYRKPIKGDIVKRTTHYSNVSSNAKRWTAFNFGTVLGCKRGCARIVWQCTRCIAETLALKKLKTCEDCDMDTLDRRQFTEIEIAGIDYKIANDMKNGNKIEL